MIAELLIAFLAINAAYFVYVGLFAYLRSMGAKQKIIKLIEETAGVMTRRQRTTLMSLGFKMTGENKVNPSEALVIQELEQHLEYKSGHFEYMLSAIVLYLNQVVEVCIAGSMKYIVYSEGSDGGHYEAPANPDTELTHGCFDDAIVHLVGDPEEAPFPMQEKAMINLVVDFFSQEKYDELVG